MAATQYVGAHYVPHGWEEWNQNTYYDGLFCVSYNYSWFIAKQNVPAGISPVNTEYWAPYSLTTGAQHEMEEFVRRYNPTESLPDDFDIDTVMDPGEYFFNNYHNLTGGPRYQFITDYTREIKGTLSVRRCADTFKPKYTILKRLTLDMEYPWVFTSAQTTNSGFSPWQIESSAGFNLGAMTTWINNADVFETIIPSNQTKYYYFGTGCTNMPAMETFIIVIQTGYKAFAFGGLGNKNSTATSCYNLSEKRWTNWNTAANRETWQSITQLFPMQHFTSTNHKAILYSGSTTYAGVFYLIRTRNNKIEIGSFNLVWDGTSNPAISSYWSNNTNRLFTFTPVVNNRLLTVEISYEGSEFDGLAIGTAPSIGFDGNVPGLLREAPYKIT